MQKKNINFSYFAATSINMMSMLAGVGYAWSSPCIPKLSSESPHGFNPLPHPATVEEISWITSLHCVGAMSGPLFTGLSAVKFGKKKTLLIFAVPQVVSNVMLIFAKSISELYIARFLMGIGTGCVFSLVPIYVAEISDVNHRGRTSMFLPLMITFTQDFIFIIGPFVTIRTLAIISLVPSILFFTLFGFFVPESPYYFIKNNNIKEAETALIKARQNKDVNEELQDIIKLIKESNNEFTLRELVNSRTARKSFLLCLALIFFQQFNGVNAIGSYQQSIFAASKSSLAPEKAVMITGSVQLFVIFLVSKLIDTWGRKNLLLISYLGQLISLVSLAIYFHLQSINVNVDYLFWLPVTSILVYMVNFKLGAGPVSWTIVSEVLPPNFKFILSPLIAFVMTFMSFLVSFVFPRFWMRFSLEVLFWGFSLVVASALPFVLFVVPETKGKTFAEIQYSLEKYS